MISTSSPQKRTLFLITSSFPYGEFETFLEAEFHYLSYSFHKVFIICNQQVERKMRISTEDVSIHYLPYLPEPKEKWQYPKFFFNPQMLCEIKNLIIKDRHIPSYGILAAMAGSLTVGQKLMTYIIRLVSTNQLWETDLYAYSYWCNDMATGLALLKTQYPKIHCICRAHGHDVYLERTKYKYLPFRRFIFSNVDKVCFISQHGKKYTEALFGTFPAFEVSYLGVNKANDRIPPQSVPGLHLVSCSSLIPLKRIHIIIEAISLFSDLQIHWTHIGSGELEGTLREYALEFLQGKPNISYDFRGQLTNRDTLRFYGLHKIDLFLNVSSHEGIPVSIMEAMSYGIPAVGPDVGGMGEIIDNKVNGFLVRQQLTAKTLKSIIQTVASLSATDKAKMSENARLKWRNSFQAEANYHGFINKILTNCT